MTETAGQQGRTRRTRRTRQGVVVSDVRDKTIKVTCEYWQKHAKYGKIMRRRTTLHAHDPENQAHVGDLVEVMSSRPISKQKSWRLVRIIGAADGK
jgi:small subunit ribosomal protein S17